MSVKINDLIRLTMTQVKADKKRSAMLIGLCLVLLIAVGRLFVSGEDGPATAVAVAPPPTAAPMAETTDTTRGGPTLETILPTSLFRPSTTPDARASHDGAALAAEQDRKIEVDGMPRGLVRDVFSVADRSVFRPVPSASWGAAEPGASGSSRLGIWGRLAASLRSQHDSHLAVSSKARDELSSLLLQATMTGSTPVAHISGRLVRENETIDGFRVLRITDRQVLLRKSGLTWRLSLP